MYLAIPGSYFFIHNCKECSMKRIFCLLSYVAVAMISQSIAYSQIQITTGDLTNYFGAGKSWFQYYSSASDTVLMNVGSASGRWRERGLLPL